MLEFWQVPACPNPHTSRRDTRQENARFRASVLLAVQDVHSIPAMTPTEARSILATARLSVADLGQLLAGMGDSRPRPTILRGLFHALDVDRPDYEVPWAVAGLVRALALYRRAVSEKRYISHLERCKVRNSAQKSLRKPRRKRRDATGLRGDSGGNGGAD